ncbi:MAG: cysteine-rich CWC family protein [Burkholderiaceae bacterium]|nr:cysteine-rich CWC family protein [Burkholderiaceae bacterium]
MEAGDTECWCAQLPPLMPLPASIEFASSATTSCLCPACLKESLGLSAEQAPPQKLP